ncbi:MAG: tetratricopeptide repeat protein [Chloroflexi bacterium]|nr:tetratricopeptide repeat protein [Chloroflexota bacterium]
MSLSHWLGAALRIALIGIGLVGLGVSARPLELVQAFDDVTAATESNAFERVADSYMVIHRHLPWDIDYLSLAAEADLKAGNYIRAEQHLLVVAERRELTPLEIAWLGSIYAGQGRQQEAVAAWESARALGILDAGALLSVADFYLARQDWQRARNVLEAAVIVIQDDDQLYYRLGLLQALDDPEEAELSLALAVSLNEDRAIPLARLRAVIGERNQVDLDEWFTILGETYLDMDELLLARTALSRAVAYNPAYATPLAYLSYVYASLGEPALGAAQQAYSLNPDSPVVNFIIGLTWKRLGQQREARHAFERAYDLNPLDPAFAVEIASTWRADNQHEAAEAWMLEAVRLAPEDLRWQILLVQFYMDEAYKVEEEGLPLALSLVERLPDNATVRDALGLGYFHLGLYDLALEEFDVAIELDPTLARAYLNRGSTLEFLGDLQGARIDYERAVELDPASPIGERAERALAFLGTNGEN